MPRLDWFISGGLVLLITAGHILAVEPEKRAVNAAADARQFAIECRLIDETGEKQAVTHCPRVTVFEHQRATVTDQVKRPFVVSVTPRGAAYEPIVEVLPEGWTIDIVCHSGGSDRATLDITLERSQITKVEVEKLDANSSVQRPQIVLTKSRHFQTLRSGEPLILALDGKPLADSKLRADLVVIDLGIIPK